MVITLIGYRGSGKSSVAQRLAAALQMPWIDSDDIIEERAGRSIREIFAEDGEDEFRRLEQTVVQELTGRSSLVIAAGGGAILAADNRRCMKAAGPVVWLQASITHLADRIRQDDTTGDRRPGLTGLSAAEEVEEVLTARLPQYKDAATITINTDGLNPDQVVDEICGRLAAPGDLS